MQKPGKRMAALAARVRRGFDLPEEQLFNTVRVELSGDTEAVVEGCLGVLEYGADAIAFHAGALTVRLRGSDLTIVSFQDGIAAVRGRITAAELER